MIRIGMGAQGWANTRFVISPLHTLIDGLMFAYCPVQPQARELSARLRDTLRQRRLTVLSGLFAGHWNYIPDFTLPRPAVAQGSLDGELHAVATTNPARLTRELDFMLHQPATRRTQLATTPRELLKALDRGEASFAERAAGEMARLWDGAIARQWSALQARIECDIARRARTMSRQGLAAVFPGLDPRIGWHGDHLSIDMPFDADVPQADVLLLAPSVFNGSLSVALDPLPEAGPQHPVISYPAHPTAADHRDAGKPAADQLAGTRGRILRDLATPRTTTELAHRHWLTPSAVSHHLTALHRAGFLLKTREQHRVYYQLSDRGHNLAALYH
ncbi:helix-turn-helix protein [Streptomyces sp. 1114.5]|uniref:winged helix-turn-helix domain-containing protein n=1 Tax=unclassified Streptomyces TaxID=2593676 RepID=UPI000BD5FC9E|nr:MULTISPECIES: winged helix-turn-helix domain-containing protein [unclassified Streptomyces]RKT09579.1 helix-turn-helix protein [Streptomyces sp. 1114.5]SOB88415.1 Helix-turn-helix domain-containing protein [Streptomyces sp. 1331.2]